MDKPEQPASPLARLLEKIKLNPVIASLLTLTTVIVAVSSFTGAAKNLLSLIPESRPAISGKWQAKVTYDWPNSNYKETFVFDDEGDVVLGTASLTESKLAIFNGKLQGNVLTFITKSQEGVSGVWKDVTHSYHGKVANNEIKFVILTEGGYSNHVPVEFTATKIADTSGK